MNAYCLTSIFSFIHNAIAVIEITGELTFDIHPISANGESRVKHKEMAFESQESNTDNSVDLSETPKFDILRTKFGEKETEECLYQYPDRKQVEALLSDMMNQLTKIFIRAYEYIGGRDARRGDKRFKIVNKKFDSNFFEQAYNLMMKEYRQSLNTTAEIARLSSHDPCHHQPEIKQMWKNLLEHSRTVLKRAAVRCISDFLRVRNRADDTKTREKMGQLLRREIKEVRSNQLKVLCDDFKLCYRDLL